MGQPPPPTPPTQCPGLTTALGFQLVEQVSPGKILEEVVVAVVHRAQVPGHRVGAWEPQEIHHHMELLSPRQPSCPEPLCCKPARVL